MRMLRARSIPLVFAALACGSGPRGPSTAPAAEPAPGSAGVTPPAAPARPRAEPSPAGELAIAPEAPPVGALEPPAAAPALPEGAATLVVALTFDDSYASQLEAAALLEAHGLRGTFYVNSPRLHEASANPGTSPFMSVADALALQARGHELGGHTLSHPSLTALPEAERLREILGDRAELLALGLEARSFAYPRGDVEVDDASLGQPVLEIARESGYSNARDTNGFSLGRCEPGPERLPPRDAFLVRSVRSVNDAPPATAEDPAPPADTAATLLGWMDAAASCGGGWLPLIFHHLRADCAAPEAPGSYCFPYSELEVLARALAAGVRCPEDGACYRVEVAPVSASLGPSELRPAIDVFALRNASLERALASGASECFQTTQGDQGTALFERSPAAHTGAASQRIRISEPFVAPAEVRITRDFGACAPFAAPGRAYDLSLFYRADPGEPAPELRLLAYRLTSDYTWEQWESSEAFLAQEPGEWVQQTFRTSRVPGDTLALSFGLRLQSVGVVEVDDFAGAPVAPVP